jgi:hypothetical protein
MPRKLCLLDEFSDHPSGLVRYFEHREVAHRSKRRTEYQEWSQATDSCAERKTLRIGSRRGPNARLTWRQSPART